MPLVKHLFWRRGSDGIYLLFLPRILCVISARYRQFCVFDSLVKTFLQIMLIHISACESIQHMLCCCRNLPPSQGGKYVGFGSSFEPEKKDDFLEQTMSSLSTVGTLTTLYYDFVLAENTLCYGFVLAEHIIMAVMDMYCVPQLWNFNNV